MIDSTSLSTILPLYNERACIPGVLLRVEQWLREHFADFEMIIVESGSSDGSGEACDEYAAGKPFVTVIHEGARNGFGAALKLGFSRATKDLSWAVSLDLPFPLESVLQAVPLMADHDVVLSYRCDDNRSLYRRLQSKVYNRLAKWLMHVSVTHINSTFKLYKTPVIQAIDFHERRWLVDTEIVYELQRRGVRFAEIPVPLIDRELGTSTITAMTPFEIFGDLLRLAKTKRRERRAAARAASGSAT